MLAYLLILSGYIEPGANLDEVADNSNRIYEKVLAGLIPRNWGDDEHPGMKGLEKKDFFFLLECLGLAAWAGGGRVGTDEEFERVRDHCAMGSQRQRYAGLHAASLKNVATQFYTHAQGGYEFIHKTFGEYLAARGMLRFAKNMLAAVEQIDGDGAMLAPWLKLTGDAEVNADSSSLSNGLQERPNGGMFIFLKNEARLLTLDDALAVKDRMNRLLKAALRDGFPAHIGLQTSWREGEARQRNAEISMLACLNATAQRVGEADTEAAQILVPQAHRLSVQELFSRVLISGNQSSIAKYCFDFMNFDGADLEQVPLASASMQNSKLSNVNFSGAMLSGATLKNAVLSEAVFESAFLIRTDFEGADFSHARLPRAILASANLRSSILEHADFRDADLQDANLENATLINAMMHGANMAKAQNLTQTQVDSADGNHETLLPEDLRRPDHWLTENK